MMMLPTLLLVAAAQATAAVPPAAAPSHRWTRLFISPMGEPFRSKGRDDDTLSDWFAQADKNHDGRLTLDEMQADAERFFATLDVTHDGEIDPDDITRYETVVAPEVTSGSSFGLFEAGDTNNHKFIRGATDQHQGAGRFGLLDLPEPVVAADSNFNRGVSVTEFRQAAAQRFLALDLDHHGYLTLDGLEVIRPAPPTAPKAPKRPDTPDLSALPDSADPH
jgi:Ca2+-binding EF-hand superfamily protein